MDGSDLGWHFHGDRRLCSHHSVLLLGRSHRGDYFVWHQSGATLSRGRIEIADHDPFLVGIRSGNDLDWRHRCSRHIRAWACFRRTRLTRRAEQKAYRLRRWFRHALTICIPKSGLRDPVTGIERNIAIQPVMRGSLVEPGIWGIYTRLARTMQRNCRANLTDSWL